MNKYTKANQAIWDELADIHFASKFYDVAGFRSGKNTLGAIEREELGNLTGKTILHLQCHFGMDSISLTQMGATVTGVDFSARAIDLAKRLALEMNSPANFVCSNVYELTEKKGSVHLEKNFDLVFTSYGVLCWLNDLRTWAHTIASYLKPGGLFYIADLHPLSNVFEYEKDRLVPTKPYFFQNDPILIDKDGSYADKNVKLENKKSYEWNHSLSEIATSLIEAGLTIEHLHEFPFCPFQRFDHLIKGDDKYWHFPPGSAEANLPLLFSISARKR